MQHPVRGPVERQLVAALPLSWQTQGVARAVQNAPPPGPEGLPSLEGFTSSSLALSIDLYEFTMGASYAALGMGGLATFSLFVRKLPPRRAFLVVAGVGEAVARALALRFDEVALDALRRTAQVREDFLDALAAFRFSGDIWAIPEGRVIFEGEPILEVTAPIAQAQLVETLVLNAVHFPTLVATKAARCVEAAPGKALIDFGLRRAPGVAAGLVAARACSLAGFAATSNVLAAARFEMPAAGTVAHSFVEASRSELEAFLGFASTFPGPATLLLDTYNTDRGAARAIEVARRLDAAGGALAAVRIDSGDLLAASRAVRARLDAAGLLRVKIVASGGLDEDALAALERAGAPIDAYGVGTRVATSADAPVADMAYKLVAYEGRPCLKLSAGKQTLVGPKQVWRARGPGGHFTHDVLACRDEPPPSGPYEPLLAPVVGDGRVVAHDTLDAARARHRAEISSLPMALRRLDGPEPYSVALSAELERRQREAVDALRRRELAAGD